ncbi:hypothetical protein KZZ52_33570 [Dactylosporangium sp. AC04546]|uniref:hypothetical protein n=1 Tax=Dactylosporangium sp. AC04546 TaxID=2862460 RepID=UPI001EDDCD0B|nr:hypothetical protein [Dactylosporangium sp. AC04546]WVK89893.1 hypothetical protein KZZ52_33570 [Dactylosporangium sp. AC04546]
MHTDRLAFTGVRIVEPGRSTYAGTSSTATTTVAVVTVVGPTLTQHHVPATITTLGTTLHR